MPKYIPTTKQVRKAFVSASAGWERATSTAKAGFNRWLKLVMAQAWEEGYAAGDADAFTIDRLNTPNPYRDGETE